MKKDIDLDILGMDNDTAERLSEDFAVPESSRDRIYRRSRRLYREKAGSGDSVQGVERYRRSIWSRIAAAAAVTAVIAGTGVGALLLLKGRAAPPEITGSYGGEEPAESEAATEAPTAAPTEAPTKETLYPVEILQSEHRVMTDSEHGEMIMAAYEDYKKNGPRRLDRERYINEMKAAKDTDSLNAPELKSYIYEMMLTSEHYFSTVSGHHTFGFNGAVITTDFGYDQENHYSWTEVTDELNRKNYSTYLYDGLFYDVSDVNMTYRKSFAASGFSGMNLGINDWMVLNKTGENVSVAHQGGSWTGLASSCGIEPQLSQSHLNDLTAWQINSVTEVNGRECAEVEGDWWKGHFKFYVDLWYGFLIMYDNSQGDHYELSDLRIDEPVEKKIFDPTGYTDEVVQYDNMISEQYGSVNNND